MGLIRTPPLHLFLVHRRLTRASSNSASVANCMGWVIGILNEHLGEESSFELGELGKLGFFELNELVKLTEV